MFCCRLAVLEFISIYQNFYLPLIVHKSLQFTEAITQFVITVMTGETEFKKWEINKMAAAVDDLRIVKALFRSSEWKTGFPNTFVNTSIVVIIV